LLVIDPISAVIPGDQNKVETIRAVLDPLTILARDLRIAVVGIMHFNKGGGRASDKLSGSHAYRDVARSVLVVAHDGDTGERVVTVDKSNYGESQGKSWTFTLESSDVLDAKGETMSVPCARVTGETDVSVEQIINRGPDTDSASEDRNAAQEFVLDFLEEHGGEASAGDVMKAGAGAGFDRQELKDARRRCKNPRIVSGKSGMSGGWVWSIETEGDAEGGTKVAKVACPENVPPSGEICHLREDLPPSERLSDPLPGAPIPETRPAPDAVRERIVSTAGAVPATWTDPTWGVCTLPGKGPAQPLAMRDYSRWRKAGAPALDVPDSVRRSA
jgi:hypothetical protein